MNKKEKKRITIIAIAIWIIFIAMLITTAQIKAPRTTDGKIYDQACLTELRKNPLRECEVKQ